MTKTRSLNRYYFRIAAASVFLFFVAVFGQQDACATEESISYELRGGHWYNGRSFEQKTVYVHAGRLRFTSPKQATEVVELNGKYVIPPPSAKLTRIDQPVGTTFCRTAIFSLRQASSMS